MGVRAACQMLEALAWSGVSMCVRVNLIMRLACAHLCAVCASAACWLGPATLLLSLTIAFCMYNTMPEGGYSGGPRWACLSLLIGSCAPYSLHPDQRKWPKAQPFLGYRGHKLVTHPLCMPIACAHAVQTKRP